MKLFYAYIHTGALVVRDFYIFGQFVRETVRVYARATYEVAIDLYVDVMPKKLSPPTLPSLPSLSLPAIEITEPDGNATLFKYIAIILVVFVLIVLWLLFVLISVGR